jgi:hypothetical protein
MLHTRDPARTPSSPELIWENEGGHLARVVAVPLTATAPVRVPVASLRRRGVGPAAPA